MYQDIENIIKKKHNELFKIDFNLDYNTKLNLQRAILDSLADEVLKVVKREIIHIIEKDYQDEYRISGEFGEKRIDTELYHKIINGLTNSSTLEGEQSEHLSPNKENKEFNNSSVKIDAPKPPFSGLHYQG